MDSLYREIILEHWKYPQNYGVLDKPDVDISDLNPLCGDEIRITAKIRRNKITEILYTCEGCAVSKASASLLTLLVKDMEVDKYEAMTPEEFLNTFEICFSPARLKCALLGFSTLKKALKEKKD
jgi:nitrogen fixation NifU-like protein